jgi:hypothetical protein
LSTTTESSPKRSVGAPSSPGKPRPGPGSRPRPLLTPDARRAPRAAARGRGGRGAREDLAFLDKQLLVPSASVTFPRADLDRVLARLATERAALERDSAQLRAREQARRKSLDAAQAELNAARGAAARNGAKGAPIARLERALGLRRVQAHDTNVGDELLRALIDVSSFSRST